MKKRKGSSFLAKSQKKIDDLKRKLRLLSKKEVSLEKEEQLLKKHAKAAQKELKVIVSVESVIKATIAILLLLGLVNILGIIQGPIIKFAVALFLAATFNPAVDRLHRYNIPRALGIIIIYILVIGIFVIMFSNLIPIIVTQIIDLSAGVETMVKNLISGNSDSFIARSLQPYLDQFWQNVDETEVISSVTKNLDDIVKQLGGFAGNALGAVIKLFNGVFNLFLVLIITFFMVVNKQHTSDFFHSLFPHRYSAYITLKSKQITIRIGEWVRGQLLLALAMGVLTFLFFWAIGLNYALTLAMLSALAEFIPYLGPIITFGSAALIALNQDPVLILWLIPAYAILQFVEGNILVPLIVGRSVGLNPIVVIFALLCGAAIGYSINANIGLAVVGMIIAVPTANIISIFVEDYTGKNK